MKINAGKRKIMKLKRNQQEEEAQMYIKWMETNYEIWTKKQGTKLIKSEYSVL